MPYFKDHSRVMHKTSTDYTFLVLKILPAELYLEATKEMILGIKLPLPSSTHFYLQTSTCVSSKADQQKRKQVSQF